MFFFPPYRITPIITSYTNIDRKEVLPFYGNTHTTTSVTSLQTTLFRHEARDIFRNATNAAEEDAVIFTGSGTTAAVHKLINAMSLHQVCCSLIYRF